MVGASGDDCLKASEALGMTPWLGPQVIGAVDAHTVQGRCVVSGGPRGGNVTCALHDAWSQARAVLLEALGSAPPSSVTADVVSSGVGDPWAGDPERGA